MAVYLYLSMMGSINEIQIYYIHVVTIMLLVSVSCIASLPFTNPLPWPYGIIKCLIECTPMFFEYCYLLIYCFFAYYIVGKSFFFGMQRIDLAYSKPQLSHSLMAP